MGASESDGIDVSQCWEHVMSIEKARVHLKAMGLEDRIMEFEQSSATVELAAKAVGCEPARIAKTLSLHVSGRVALVLFAGDAAGTLPDPEARTCLVTS